MDSLNQLIIRGLQNFRINFLKNILLFLTYPTYFIKGIRLLSNVTPKSALLCCVFIQSFNVAQTNAQQNVFSPIESFSGIRYALGYDTSTQAVSGIGQPCINFDEKQIYHSGDGKHEIDQVSITRTSQLVSNMGLSIEAQLNAVGGVYKANSALEMVAKTEVHRFSNTKLYYSHKKGSEIFLKPEYMSIREEFQPLLESGIEGKDEFRAKCGDSFIIGLQKGAYFYATYFETSETTKKEKELNFDFRFDYNLSTRFSLETHYKKSQLEELYSKKIAIKRTTTDGSLPATKDPKVIEKQWENFNENSSSPIIVAFTSPYTLVKGSMPKGVLVEDVKERKMQVLLNSLWDLKSLKEEANYVVRNNVEFALGLPRTKQRKKRLEHISMMATRWRTELDNLLNYTKICMKSFDKNCTRLANWYDDYPRIIERKYLPKKYTSYCYGNFFVGPKSTTGRINMYDSSRGDNEMAGHKILLTASMDIQAFGRELVMRINTKAMENKRDWTTFMGSHQATVFTLNPKFEGMADNFKNCEYSNNPIASPFINDKKHRYGNVHYISAKNRRTVTAPGAGLINSIKCKIDSKGKDNGKLYCEFPEINNFRVVVVNKFDKEAAKWRAPKLIEVPTLFVKSKDKFKKMNMKIMKHNKYQSAKKNPNNS